MARYFLQISYSGTNYHGWQIQPNVRTVQETITEKLNVLFPDVEDVMGCGRTDTGVHADEFFLHFDTENEIPGNLIYKLNRMLPNDIGVYTCIPVDKSAHARYHAVEREYRYMLSLQKNPLNWKNEWWCPHELDLVKMQQCCGLIRNAKDFSAFEKSGGNSGTSLCDIRTCRWEQHGRKMVFIVSANRFLRNMVRAMVGTMLDVGQGKTSLEDFRGILESGDRKNAGKTAHARGLHLARVEYPFLKNIR